MASFGGVQTERQESEAYKAQQVNLGAGSYQGGFANAPQQIENEPNYLANALFDVADKALQVQAKKERTKKYLEGRKEIQQGNTVAQMREDDSLFNKLFMENSATLEGAIAQEVDNMVSSTYLEQLQSIDKHKKVSPEEYKKLITEQESKLLTGDDYRDLAMMKKWGAKSDSLINAHTKAHYEHMTELKVTGTMQAIELESQHNTVLKNSKHSDEKAIADSDARIKGLHSNMLNYGESHYANSILMDLDKGKKDSYKVWEEANKENELLVSPGTKRQLEAGYERLLGIEKKARDTAVENKYGREVAQARAVFEDRVKNGEVTTEEGITAGINFLNKKRAALGMKPMSQEKAKSLYSSFYKYNRDLINSVVSIRLGIDRDELIEGVESGSKTLQDVEAFENRVMEDPKLLKLFGEDGIVSLRRKTREASAENARLGSQIASVLAGNGTTATGADLTKMHKMVMNNPNSTPEVKARFRALAPVTPAEENKIATNMQTKVTSKGEVSKGYVDEVLALNHLYVVGGRDKKVINRSVKDLDDRAFTNYLIQKIEDNPDVNPGELIAQETIKYDTLQKQGYNPQKSAKAILTKSNRTSHYADIETVFKIKDNDAATDYIEKEVTSKLYAYLMNNPKAMLTGTTYKNLLMLMKEEIDSERAKGIFKYDERLINDTVKAEGMYPLVGKDDMIDGFIETAKPFGYDSLYSEDGEQNFTVIGNKLGSFLFVDSPTGQSIKVSATSFVKAVKESSVYTIPLREQYLAQQEAKLAAERQEEEDRADIAEKKRLLENPPIEIKSEDITLDF